MSNGTAERRHVIPPAVQAARMQRYSVYLVVLAFIIVGANYASLTMSSVLWFAAGLTAAFSLLCAVAVIILHGLAWNFDRLQEEMEGRRAALDVATPDPRARPSGSKHALTGRTDAPPESTPPESPDKPF